MCGITGILPPTGARADGAILRRMTRMLAHRGPDAEGYLELPEIGLGHRRLSIIDLSGGAQPMSNEDGTVWTVFNGEIFNYIELRDFLAKKGHAFRTRSDTEVIVHLYEEFGDAFVDRLNGQFAIAVWDVRSRRLVLARDRAGIRPLFHARLADGTLLFASEIKALFAHPALPREIDPAAVAQVAAFWVTVPPRTAFRGVSQLGPGGMLVVEGGKSAERRYWRHAFPRMGEYEDRPLSHWTGRLSELLQDSLALQLRSDVPVGAYLSGGLDSSITSALVKRNHDNSLATFSVAFQDPRFDESAYQAEMAKLLGTEHRVVRMDHARIGEAFPEVVWRAEQPLTRTAPAPMLALAGLVRESGFKVVLTGEGADELFGGYNIFREDKVRRFWARQPESRFRPLALDLLYGYIRRGRQGDGFWRQFFRKGMLETEDPYYSHRIRWSNSAQMLRFLSPGFRAGMPSEEETYAELEAYLDGERERWHPLCRAQYLEMMLFMPGYLLNSQGDRMMMGRSIEGRFPFLDHRLIEFAAHVPPKYKISGLEEKYVLKRAFRDILPASIVQRPKKPYRAPIAACFLGGSGQPPESMGPEALSAYGYVDAGLFGRLMAKASKEGDAVGERDEMAIAMVASLQLLHALFVEDFRGAAPAPGLQTQGPIPSLGP